MCEGCAFCNDSDDNYDAARNQYYIKSIKATTRKNCTLSDGPSDPSFVFEPSIDRWIPQGVDPQEWLEQNPDMPKGTCEIPDWCDNDWAQCDS